MIKYNIVKKVFIALTLISILFLTSPSVFAEGEFQTEYTVNYDVHQNGETSVTYDISIINNRADVIATRYALSLKQMNLTEVAAYDSKGNIELEKEIKDDTTTLTVTLREKAIGVNKKSNFKIFFKTKNIASKVGEVWNINIPQVQTMDTTNKYDAFLYVPPTFGPVIFVSPQTEEKILENGQRLYSFNIEHLKKQGITASFGKYQILNFKLLYQLSNPSVLSSVQEIALPPDIKGNQQVFYQKINPSPIKVKTDKDGNVLAQFKVPPKVTLEIELIGSARIMGRQIAPEFGGKINKIPGNLIRNYTRSEKFWETDSYEIKSIAKGLYKEENTVAQNAQAVYNYVTQTLSYNFETTKENSIERKGALASLLQKENAACMEFTDLFIAITRAMGIPARELNGYAFSETNTNTPLSVNIRGGDLLHAWAEFYDPNFGWIAVDPTWGATSKIDYFTKLDTNHFAFVIKGLDSEYPLPAGSYRFSDKEKLVEIDFANGSSSFEPINKDTLEQAQGFVTKQSLPISVIIVIIGGAVLIVTGVYRFLSKKFPFS